MQPSDKLIAPLLRVPLFRGLRPLQITEIARQAERVRFRKGATVTKTGDQADAAYVIVEGQAECVADQLPLPAAEPVEVGSLIGEMAMFVEHSYGSTVVARTAVHCLRITRAAMHSQMLADPQLTEHFTRQIADRLGSVADQLRAIDRLLTPHKPAGKPVRSTTSPAVPDVAQRRSGIQDHQTEAV